MRSATSLKTSTSHGPYPLPEGWRWVKLGEFMSQPQKIVNPKNFPDESFDLYSISAHDNSPHGFETISGSHIGSSKISVQPTDVLLSKIVPHIRRARIVGKINNSRQIASSEWIVFRNAGFISNYLAHFLTSDIFHPQYMSTTAGVGGSLTRARPNFVKEIPIPLPPLPEQQRIADILDRAANQKNNSLLLQSSLATIPGTLFTSIFGDPDTASNKTSLGELATLSSGRSIVGSDLSNESAYRVLKISSVTSGIFKPTESKPLPENYTPPTDHLVHDGDLLMSRANTSELVGAVAYVENSPGNAALPDKIWKFIWRNQKSEPLFYLSLLSNTSIRRKISQLATGSGGSMKNISKNSLLSMPVPDVPIGKQREFVSKVRAMQENQSTVSKLRSFQNELFASLQYRAFRGEL